MLKRPGIAAAAALPLVLALGISVIAAASDTLTRADCATTPAPPGSETQNTDVELGAAQRANAQIIYNVGIQLGVPHRGEVIAIATALQESHLVNHSTAVDHDSLGLFQQRPSAGWGRPNQILDPVYASTAFYQRLVHVPNWQQLPLTVAAQTVQRSAFPNAYATWENLATTLASDAAQAIGRAINDVADCQPDCPTATAGAPNPAPGQVCEWVAPVRAPIVSGFRTAGRPDHDGVDLGAPRSTPIRAASTGTVAVVRCNITPTGYGCNRDGNPGTPGCGWYVDIIHTGRVITRYCHMLTRPLVTIGQHVNTGQIIGYVGSSGHSSGPHLHFEVHLDADRSPAGAIDPIAFMRDRNILFR